MTVAAPEAVLIPSPSAASATSAQREGAYLAPPHPGHEEKSRGPVAGGEDGDQVRRPERPRLSSAAVAGGPPVAGEDPGGAFPGRARRGHQYRGARRRYRAASTPFFETQNQSSSACRSQRPVPRTQPATISAAPEHATPFLTRRCRCAVPSTEPTRPTRRPRRTLASPRSNRVFAPADLVGQLPRPPRSSAFVAGPSGEPGTST